MGYKRIVTIEDIMENRNRALIYRTIVAYPGASFSDIRMLLGIKNGTLSHHLIKLEKEGLIKSKKMGIFRKFYPSSGVVPKDLEEKIMDVVLDNPGISQSMVARSLEITRQVANYHISSLKRKGMVIVKRSGRDSQVFMR
ncbi:MAG: winged helix-turn-helix transcriptional regulator [Candidatus Thermoplasmatota archaeon]|jgi:predicted transcriptional regulator|nr:winged helix-turn-helix transcriptional regulator [Candidatus Thermoplasmatota archaeon]